LLESMVPKGPKVHKNKVRLEKSAGYKLSTFFVCIVSNE
jgi:hypothetical protein